MPDNRQERSYVSKYDRLSNLTEGYDRLVKSLKGGGSMKLSSIRLVNEEIYGQNKTATVYHRTKSIESIESVLKSGFSPGDGAFYGEGLYTTYDIESQNNEKMKKYGPYIIKFIVRDLDQYMIFDPVEAKKIHGNDWSLDSQCAKFGVPFTPTLKNKVDEWNGRSEVDPGVNRLVAGIFGPANQSKSPSKPIFSSNLAKFFFDELGESLTSKVKGMVFHGQHDGRVMVKYMPVDDGTIVMAAYAYNPVWKYKRQNQEFNDYVMANRPKGWFKDQSEEPNWIKITNKASIKSVYGLEPGEKRSNLSSFRHSRGPSRTIYKVKNQPKFMFYIKDDYEVHDMGAADGPTYTYIAGVNVSIDDSGEPVPSCMILKVMSTSTINSNDFKKHLKTLAERLDTLILDEMEDEYMEDEDMEDVGTTWEMPVGTTFESPIELSSILNKL